MMRESGGYDPSRMPSSNRSRTWSASTLRTSEPAAKSFSFRSLARHELLAVRSARLGHRAGRDIDRSCCAVDADAVAGGNAVSSVGGADYGRNAEFPRQHGWVRGRPARVRHQSDDLGKEHDPCGVRHLADEY